MKADTMGDRLKTYEEVWNTSLPIRTPIIIRLDGRAFHTLTKKFQKPFDPHLHQAMTRITKALCEEIVNARVGYTQSDEISILAYPKSTVSGYWFDNRIQKLASITASLASVLFYKELQDRLGKIIPSFDARVFTIPQAEVHNYFLWRQFDAIRNSVAALAQANFSVAQLQNKKRDDMLAMLLSIGIDWHQIEGWKQRGSIVELDGQTWQVIDAPILAESKDYFESHLVVNHPEKKVS